MPAAPKDPSVSSRSQVVVAISKAREDLDRTLARLEMLAHDDRQRVSYSLHALNNYLMVVSTTVRLLQTKLVPRGDRDTRKWLDSLKQATNLMMSTARGVLTANAETLPPLLLEPSSLAEIAEAACLGYAGVARLKQVRILWKSPGSPDSVLTDRVAAGAVLDNLLSNAVKYSAPGSTISVRMTIGAQEVVCSVRDRGPGLSDEDQRRLFQRGVTLSAAPTAGESSTGYGLAIAHDLVRALGGQLVCTSTLGHGSCFTFSLPLLRDVVDEETAPLASAQGIRASAGTPLMSPDVTGI